MSAPARKPLSKSQIRAIAIKRSIARRADNDNQPRTRRTRTMSPALLADCVAASGFEQHAAR